MRDGIAIDQIIKTKMVALNFKQKTLAEGCGLTPAGLNWKFKNQQFSVSDLEKIADTMGCDLDIAFVTRDGKTASRATN